MARIKYGKQGHLELEITPVAIWSNPDSEGEFMEYQIGLFCEGVPVFNSPWQESLIALKDEENIYLSDFIRQTLASHEASNWSMLEPKVSLFMHPLQSGGCCSSYNRPDNFLLQITLEQNIFAGEDKIFGDYSNTGMGISFEASAKDWLAFAADIRAEEEDFDEEE